MFRSRRFFGLVLALAVATTWPLPLVRADHQPRPAQCQEPLYDVPDGMICFYDHSYYNAGKDPKASGSHLEQPIPGNCRALPYGMKSVSSWSGHTVVLYSDQNCGSQVDDPEGGILSPWEDVDFIDPQARSYKTLTPEDASAACAQKVDDSDCDVVRDQYREASP